MIMEASKKQPKLIKELARVADGRKGIFRLIQLWGYQDRKFRFIFENSNGTPCGFDYKHCIKVFNYSSDEWKSLADKDEIDGLVKSSLDYDTYYGNEASIIRDAENFMKACKEYIKLIY